MNNLTNEQIARVFAMYWGQECLFVKPKNEKGHVFGYAMLKSEDGSCKLLLTPLSSISDEDAIEVAKMMMVGSWPQRKYVVRRDSHSIDISTNGGSTFREFTRIVFHNGHIWSNKGINHNSINTVQVYQYLTQKGYAVPLFISPKHPDNGKTAIELGLAIDKTKIK